MTYCVDADMDKAWGTANMTEWADLDNDANAGKITARKLWGRTAAYADINDALRSTHYTLPLATIAAATPTTITQLEAVMAGLKIYEARATSDDEGEDTQYARMRQWAANVLAEIRSGSRRLEAM